MKKKETFLQKIWRKIDPFWILMLIILIFFIIMAKIQEKKESQRDYGFRNKSAVHLVLKSTFLFFKS